MSNKAPSPATGFPNRDTVKQMVKDSTQALMKRNAAELASSRPAIQTSNLRMAATTLGSGLQNAAVSAAATAATSAARSVSDKIHGALGGKLSSTLGSGATNRILGSVNKTINNLATGTLQKVPALGQSKLGAALSSSLGSGVGGLLGSTLSKMSDGAAKNLAGAKVVPGFLETGPKDEALVVDPYGVSDNSILNNVAKAASGMVQDAIESLRRSPDLIADLTSMTLLGEGSFSMVRDNLANRVIGSLGGQYGIVNNLTGSLRESIVNGRGLPEGIFDTAVMVVNHQVEKFNANGMENARQVYSLVDQITSHRDLNQFFDIGSESALMAGVMRELIALRVPGSLEVLVEKAPHEEVAYNALYANMRVAVEYSDLDTVNLMIDHLGPEAFLARVPDAVQVLLSNYELPLGTHDGLYAAEWIALQACLDSLSPGWGRTLRNGEVVSDLSFYATLSEDAKKLMLLDPEYQIAALVGPAYQGTPDMLQELRQRYPYLPLT